MAKVTVPKVNSKAHVAELDNLTGAMERLYAASCGDGATLVAKDAVLTLYFASLRTLSAQTTTAIKQTPVLSSLDAADGVRDDATRDLFTLVTGYTASPFADVKAAAQAVSAVLAKYGKSMTSVNYAEQSSLTESLLEELGGEALTGHIALLAGVAELVATLRAAQDGFTAANDEYMAAKRAKGDSATSLKKPLVALINDSIVPYLNVVTALDGYADLAAAIADEIKKLNDIVLQRATSAAAKKNGGNE